MGGIFHPKSYLGMNMKYNVKNFTNEEKIKLVIGKNGWQTNDLGGKLPSVLVSDGPLGVRSNFDENHIQHPQDLPSTAYPSFEVLSQTWNLDLARKYGNMIADDCIDRNIDIILAPGINIKRNPLCGRNFEYFSEDPYLAGHFGKEYILGVQEKHVGTSLKHYCANNSEYQRVWASSEVDERTLNEIYLRNFVYCFEAKPWTLMCSYNLLNGLRMSENEPLYNYAQENGFDGIIISDWSAVKNAPKSINSGLSLIMPFEDKIYAQLENGLKDNSLNLQKLDKAAQNVLDLISKNEEEKKLRKVSSTVEERSAFAQMVAEEGIVLLKNDNVLPLKAKDKVIVGGYPTEHYVFGGGSSNVPLKGEFVTLYQAFKDLKVDVDTGEVIWTDHGYNKEFGNFKEFYNKCVDKDVIVLGVGFNNHRVFEGADLQNISLTSEEILIIESLHKLHKKVVLVVYGGGAIDLTYESQLVDAILYVGFGGENVSKAIANILVGKVNPSGKLTETFACLDDYPSEFAYKDESLVCYKEGLNVGYRYFTTEDIDVLFPFGFGLSYTDFEYSNLKVTNYGEKVEVEVDVKNVGQVDGKEVVQLYISDLTKVVYRPLRELKGFKKVFLKKGEKKTVKLELERKDFAFYSVNYHKFIVNDGTYDIEICKNANEVIVSKAIKYK